MDQPLACACIPGYKKFIKLNKNQQKKALACCSGRFIDSITELAHHTLHSKHPYHRINYKPSGINKKVLKVIANPLVPQATRRKLLVQKGGFLPVLLKFALPILSGLVADKLFKR